MSELTRGQQIGRSAGLALFAVVGFFYLASGLVVPTWPWLVILGIWGATLSSGIGSIMGAPRILRSRPIA